MASKAVVLSECELGGCCVRPESSCTIDGAMVSYNLDTACTASGGGGLIGGAITDFGTCCEVFD